MAQNLAVKISFGTMRMGANLVESQALRELRRQMDERQALKGLGDRISRAIGFDETDGQLVAVKHKLFKTIY